jgi:hypothetical protein
MLDYAIYYEFVACLMVIGIALKTRALLPALISLEFSVSYLLGYTFDQYLFADLPLIHAAKAVFILALLATYVKSNLLLNLGYLLAFVVSSMMYAAWLYYAKTGNLGFGNVAFVCYQWGIFASMIMQMVGTWNGRNNGKRSRLRYSSNMRNNSTLWVSRGVVAHIARADHKGA